MKSYYGLNRRILFAICVFFVAGTLAFSKGIKLSGKITDVDDKKVKKAIVQLLDMSGEEVGEEKTGGNGKYSFKKLEPGEYTLKVSHEEKGNGQSSVVLADGDKKKEVNVTISVDATPAVTQAATDGQPTSGSSSSPLEKRLIQDANAIPTKIKSPTATGGSDRDFVLNELNFEIKKLTAEFKYISQELDDLKALSKMWINPLTIYSKEIILKNGSTVFGKIIYQDDKTLKVETLVGYLIIERDQVIRIIDNVITDDSQEYIPEQIRDSYTPPPMPKLAEPRYTSNNNSARNNAKHFSANCVLVGNITEKKDSRGNIIFTGELKNIGGRRADFTKIDFVFRKNWSGETKTLTTFAKGSYNTFESGIVSDASLLPGAVGNFELYVPSEFGTFIGYSYVIDWEEYE
ncbi:MAG: carboxypeptidase regulatory-like domain-containing protein [Candidatus Marinimicrobia bacterium]|nr:carboxypeptidase regulatory-like domain-containing protein [Candidatus Neomarinimicrobiota bacterium]